MNDVDLANLMNRANNAYFEIANALMAIAKELRRMNDRAEIQPEPLTQNHDQEWVDKHLGWPE